MCKAWVLALAIACAMPAAAQTGAASPLAAAPVRVAGESSEQSFDGVVEAVRQTVVAAQVAGAVTALPVKAGDSVKAGQVLARIDARTAEQGASASDAQLRSAQALLDVARKDFERQAQLHKQQYISQAALERAESQFKAAQAQAAALMAQADAARTTTGLHVVRAPYAGVVAEVPVALGDMAMPGRALLTLYEPGALRVAAALPQRVQASAAKGVRVEFPGLPEAQRWLDAAPGQLLPTVDPASHTVLLRVPLPTGLAGVAPGSFARVWLPVAAQDGTPRLLVPRSAVVRRGELNAVYVIDAKGAALLRQVRVGRTVDDSVELLSGVSAGERVALDPQAAARQP
jgi:RND family efflux transporter MFP subunit